MFDIAALGAGRVDGGDMLLVYVVVRIDIAEFNSANRTDRLRTAACRTAVRRLRRLNAAFGAIRIEAKQIMIIVGRRVGIDVKDASAFIASRVRRYAELRSVFGFSLHRCDRRRPSDEGVNDIAA